MVWKCIRAVARAWMNGDAIRHQWRESATNYKRLHLHIELYFNNMTSFIWHFRTLVSSLFDVRAQRINRFEHKHMHKHLWSIKMHNDIYQPLFSFARSIFIAYHGRQQLNMENFSILCPSLFVHDDPAYCTTYDRKVSTTCAFYWLLF